MSKFDSQTKTKAPGLGALKTTETPTLTYEGGKAVKKDLKTELFTLAVTNMVGEQTFYESAKGRDNRFVNLIRQVTKADPEWVRSFVPFLRNTANMRSASIVVAAEYVKAGGPRGRDVVASAISRADEPAEMLAYWTLNYGKRIPQPIKRGVADAARRGYNEYTALKYDGGSRNWRMADVIQLTHPKAEDEHQNELFKYLLDRRYKGADAVPGESLAKIRASQELEERVKAGHRPTADELDAAGWTWERLSGLGAMDKQAWESMIPTMGYMALLRNLRNFDQAAVGAGVAALVRKKLSDPEQVARSRQFPYRFLSAFEAADKVRWGSALEDALNESVKNIPELPGRSLVLVDVSGSMTAGVSDRSSMPRWKVGLLFGVAQALRNDADLVIFGQTSEVMPLDRSKTLLHNIAEVTRAVDANNKGGWYGRSQGGNVKVNGKAVNPYVGHGTAMWDAVRKHANGHDRTFIFTDMQTADNRGRTKNGNVYAFDLSGYSRSSINTNDKGFYMLGGFSDAVFRMVPLLEAGQRAAWPWE